VRTPLLATCLTLFLLQPWPSGPIVGSIAQAAAESREDLYRKCRREAFQRYGQPAIQYRGGRPGHRRLQYQFLTVIDQCAANGGRLN
jgi:hypothetical protein